MNESGSLRKYASYASSENCAAQVATCQRVAVAGMAAGQPAARARASAQQRAVGPPATAHDVDYAPARRLTLQRRAYCTQGHQLPFRFMCTTTRLILLGVPPISA